jgi:rsbT antagonist protein RsbS
MSDLVGGSITSATQIGGYLIIALGDQLSAGTLETDLNFILEKASQGFSGVVLNCSLVSIMDSAAFTVLKNITAALDVMGIPSVWVGLRPGVVCSLLDLGLGTDDVSVHTAGTLDEGFKLLRKKEDKRNLRSI